MRRAAALFLLCALLGGCSERGWYTLGQSFGRGQCKRMADQGSRAQCESSANTGYDSYRRQNGS